MTGSRLGGASLGFAMLAAMLQAGRIVIHAAPLFVAPAGATLWRRLAVHTPGPRRSALGKDRPAAPDRAA